MSDAFGMTEMGSTQVQNPGMMGPRPILPPKPGMMEANPIMPPNAGTGRGVPPVPPKPGMMGPRPMVPQNPNANPLSNQPQGQDQDPFATTPQERGFYQQLFVQLVNSSIDLCYF